MLGKRPRFIPCSLSSSSPHLHGHEMHRLDHRRSPSPSLEPRQIVIGFELSADSASSSPVPPPPPPEFDCSSKPFLDLCESPRSVLDSICSTPKQSITRSPLFSLLYGKKDSHGVGVGIVVCDIEGGAQEVEAVQMENGDGFGPTSISNCNPSVEVVVQEAINEYVQWSPSSEQSSYFKVSSKAALESAGSEEKEEAVGAVQRGCSSMFAASSPPPCGSFEKPSMLFLSEYCCFCRSYLHGKDIFMYRGDQAFCSMECRSQQIVIDEGTATMY